jgi:hypothetical protein
MIAIIIAGIIAIGPGIAGAASQNYVTAEIIGSDPASGATDIPVDGVVKIYFNEHVEVSNYNTLVPRDILEYTVYIERNGKRYQEVPFSMDWDFSNNTNDATRLIIGPEKGSTFKWNTTYVIYFSRGTIVPTTSYSPVTGIIRYYNLSNPENYSIRFMTKPGLFSTGTTPASGATAVSPNASIVVVFNRNITAGNKSGAIALKYAADNPDTGKRGQPVPADVAVAGDRLAITPKDRLGYSSSYQVVVPEDGVKTEDGTISLPWAFDFTFRTEPPAATPTPTPTPRSGPAAAIVAAIAALAIGAVLLHRRYQG